MGTFHVILTKISGKSRFEREGLVVVHSSRVSLLGREGMSVNGWSHCRREVGVGDMGDGAAFI